MTSERNKTMDMTNAQITEVLKKGVKEALGDLAIERKQHFEDHMYIQGQRKGVALFKRGAILTLAVSIVGFFIYMATGWKG